MISMGGLTEKTILLVKDEVIIAMAERAMLEKHGYTVSHRWNWRTSGGSS